MEKQFFYCPCFNCQFIPNPTSIIGSSSSTSGGGGIKQHSSNELLSNNIDDSLITNLFTPTSTKRHRPELYQQHIQIQNDFYQSQQKITTTNTNTTIKIPQFLTLPNGLDSIRIQHQFLVDIRPIVIPTHATSTHPTHSPNVTASTITTPLVSSSSPHQQQQQQQLSPTDQQLQQQQPSPQQQQQHPSSRPTPNTTNNHHHHHRDSPPLWFCMTCNNCNTPVVIFSSQNPTCILNPYLLDSTNPIIISKKQEFLSPTYNIIIIPNTPTSQLNPFTNLHTQEQFNNAASINMDPLFENIVSTTTQQLSFIPESNPYQLIFTPQFTIPLIDPFNEQYDYGNNNGQSGQSGSSGSGGARTDQMSNGGQINGQNNNTFGGGGGSGSGLHNGPISAHNSIATSASMGGQINQPQLQSQLQQSQQVGPTTNTVITNASNITTTTTNNNNRNSTTHHHQKLLLTNSQHQRLLLEEPLSIFHQSVQTHRNTSIIKIQQHLRALLAAHNTFLAVAIFESRTLIERANAALLASIQQLQQLQTLSTANPSTSIPPDHQISMGKPIPCHYFGQFFTSTSTGGGNNNPNYLLPYASATGSSEDDNLSFTNSIHSSFVSTANTIGGLSSHHHHPLQQQHQHQRKSSIPSIDHPKSPHHHHHQSIKDDTKSKDQNNISGKSATQSMDGRENIRFSDSFPINKQQEPLFFHFPDLSFVPPLYKLDNVTNSLPLNDIIVPSTDPSPIPTLESPTGQGQNSSNAPYRVAASSSIHCIWSMHNALSSQYRIGDTISSLTPQKKQQQQQHQRGQSNILASNHLPTTPKNNNNNNNNGFINTVGRKQSPLTSHPRITARPPLTASISSSISSTLGAVSTADTITELIPQQPSSQPHPTSQLSLIHQQQQQQQQLQLQQQPIIASATTTANSGANTNNITSPQTTTSNNPSTMGATTTAATTGHVSHRRSVDGTETLHLYNNNNNNGSHHTPLQSFTLNTNNIHNTPYSPISPNPQTGTPPPSTGTNNTSISQPISNIIFQQQSSSSSSSSRSNVPSLTTNSLGQSSSFTQMKLPEVNFSDPALIADSQRDGLGGGIMMIMDQLVESVHDNESTPNYYTYGNANAIDNDDIDEDEDGDGDDDDQIIIEPLHFNPIDINGSIVVNGGGGGGNHSSQSPSKLRLSDTNSNTTTPSFKHRNQHNSGGSGSGSRNSTPYQHGHHGGVNVVEETTIFPMQMDDNDGGNNYETNNSHHHHHHPHHPHHPHHQYHHPTPGTNRLWNNFQQHHMLDGGNSDGDDIGGVGNRGDDGDGDDDQDDQNNDNKLLSTGLEDDLDSPTGGGPGVGVGTGSVFSEPTYTTNGIGGIGGIGEIGGGGGPSSSTSITTTNKKKPTLQTSIPIPKSLHTLASGGHINHNRKVSSSHSDDNNNGKNNNYNNNNQNSHSDDELHDQFDHHHHHHHHVGLTDGAKMDLYAAAKLGGMIVGSVHDYEHVIQSYHAQRLMRGTSAGVGGATLGAGISTTPTTGMGAITGQKQQTQQNNNDLNSHEINTDQFVQQQQQQYYQQQRTQSAQDQTGSHHHYQSIPIQQQQPITVDSFLDDDDSPQQQQQQQQQQQPVRMVGSLAQQLALNGLIKR